MKPQKLAIVVVALGMMAVTAFWLTKVQAMHPLGAPGVKVGPVSIYDENHKLAATNSVLVPSSVLGYRSELKPIMTSELEGLPPDTTFGRMLYQNPEKNFAVQLTTILMGTDHTSIHQPQYCLYAQGWNVTNTERIVLHMEKPYPYDIPAMKLTATRMVQSSNGPPEVVNGIYVYWFVSGNKITADEGSRLWSIASTLLEKGEIERWAYISYITACRPGEESVSFEEMRKLIGASVPEFQTVTGTRLEPLATTAQN